MPDILRDAYNELMKSVIEDMSKEGKPAQEIESILTKRAIKTIDSITETASKHSVEYMQQHMYESDLVVYQMRERLINGPNL